MFHRNVRKTIKLHFESMYHYLFNTFRVLLTLKVDCCKIFNIKMSTSLFMVVKTSQDDDWSKIENVDFEAKDLFSYIFFSYYKFIGVNFGGLSLKRNGSFRKSFGWKVYGYLINVISACLQWISTYGFMITNEILSIKKSKRPFLYELVLISWLVRNILPIITLTTGHRYGSKLIRLAIKYRVENGKLKILFIVFWSSQLIAVVANLTYDIIIN